tara:strand:+ start:2323 stop:2592 length:270 start_codon:yes stop_codon:yes gene_type:complete
MPEQIELSEHDAAVVVRSSDGEDYAIELVVPTRKEEEEEEDGPASGVAILVAGLGISLQDPSFVEDVMKKMFFTAHAEHVAKEEGCQES